MDIQTAQRFLDQQIRLIGSFLPNVLAALLILIVGWIVAKVVSAVVRGLLKRTNFDNRMAQSMGTTGVGVENTVGTIVFWFIMLFVLMGFFQTLALTAISTPLDALIAQILVFLPRLLGAAVLLLVAWVVATVLKRVVTGLLRGLDIDRRISRAVRDDESPTIQPAASRTVTITEAPPARAATPTDRLSLADTLGEVVYWLVFLLFLPAILSTLDLGGILLPVQVMLNQIFGYLPNLFAAALILVVGWFVARIIQKIVTSLLAAAGVDRLGDRVGLSQVLGGQTLSGVLGTVVYIFVLLPVLISALNALQIPAVTGPATNMLNTILAAIPNIFAAAVVLIISYVVGRLAAELVANLLAGIGFNSLPARLGMTRATPTVGQRTPAELVGSLVLIAIMLFASMEAARLLSFGTLAELLAEFIRLGGQIILGLIVFGIGLYLANLAANMIESSGASNARLLAWAARVAILVLAGAMALRQMGIANEIVNLAFTLLLGAIAVAAALAFGLGGREAAGRELETWVNRVKREELLANTPASTPGLPGGTPTETAAAPPSTRVEPPPL
jgi:Conserved TM helix